MSNKDFPAIDALVFTTRIEISGALTGNAYEHVHHADVVRLLEQGRLALLAAMNRSLEAMFAEGLLLVVVLRGPDLFHALFRSKG